MRHFFLVKNTMHIYRLKGREFEFLIIGSSSFHMYAPFTAMGSLNKLVHALGTYKSPLSFDRVVLVEMFEIGVNNGYNAHI